MKKVFMALSVISLCLFALVDFGKNALEAYLSVQLMVNNNFGSSAYIVNAQMCQIILIALSIICLVMAIIDALKDRKR